MASQEFKDAKIDDLYGLDETQALQVQELLDAAKAANLPIAKWLSRNNETGDLVETEEMMAYRFCRARAFKVKDAIKMLKADLTWREEQAILALQLQQPSDFCDFDPKELVKSMPILLHGHDKKGRSIVYKQFGAECRIKDLLKVTSADVLVRYHIWQTEKCLQCLSVQSQSLQRPVDQMMVIIDAKGWHIGLATPSAMGFLKRIAAVDSDHYPERLGRLIVINAPYMLAWSWKVIKGWLDPRTKNKIEILGPEKNWLPRLLEEVDEEQIPEMYGGKAKMTYGYAESLVMTRNKTEK